MANNNIIAVLGSGRSGTSLLTNILGELGMNLSNNLVASSEQNPGGAFEDITIMQHQREILSLTGGYGTLPFTGDFLEIDGVEQVQEKLAVYVKESIASATTIWGFKDPRTVTLLPLWTRLCGTIKLVPSYILTIRNPVSVINSMATQYGQDRMVGETFWLTKNIDALRHTGGNVFIVHYEDWFTDKAPQVAQDLLKFTGLDQFFTGDVHEVITDLIKLRLNRSKWEKYEVKNHCVNRLYKALQECHGADFDHTHLMGTVLECQETIEEFMGWPIAAHNLLRKKDALIRKLEQQPNSTQIFNRQTDNSSLIQDNRSLVKENNTLLKENISLAEQLANLKVSQEKHKIAQQQQPATQPIDRSLVTEENYRYRLGNIFVAAAKKESSLISIPWKLMRLIWDVLTRHGRKKQKVTSKKVSPRKAMLLHNSAAYNLGGLIIGAIKSPKNLFHLPSELRKLRAKYYSL